MAFSLYKVLKGLLIREENTLTPREVEIIYGGSAGTKTTIQTSQTTNKTVTLPDATDTLVGKATTDVLTNKSIDADTNTITNIENADIKAGAGIDASKLADGSVSNTELQYINSLTSNAQDQLDSKASSADLTTHISDTTTHGTTGNIVGTSDTQTLTNKTIDADLNTISNIENADIKAAAGIDASKLADGSVSNTELQYINSLTSNAQDQFDALVAADANFATKALDNLASTAINVSLLPGVDNSINIGSLVKRYATVFAAAVNNSSNLTLSANAGAAKIILNGTSINVPQQSSDPGSAAQSDLYYNSVSKKLRYYDGSVWKDIGSGSSGSKNYLTDYLNNPGNGDFEKGTTAGWSLANTAVINDFPSLAPNAGASSITNFSINSSSTDILSGTYSLQVAAAVSTIVAQGFISDEFIIDNEDKAKVLKYSFTYRAANSVDQTSVWAVAIYDVDNNVWIQPTNARPIKNGFNQPGLAEGTFQTSSNGTTYQIFLYFLNNGDQASMIFDSFQIGPVNSLTSSPLIVTRVSQNNNQVITNTTIDFNAITFDYNGSFNLSTNEFTAPQAGVYDVSGMIAGDSAAWLAGEYLELILVKNGSDFCRLGVNVVEANSTVTLSVEGSTKIQCNAGDTLRLKGFTTRSGGISLVADASYNYATFCLVSSSSDGAGKVAYQPKVMAVLSTNQSIPNGTDVLVTFDTILSSYSNDGSSFNTSTNRYQPKEPGNYLINVNAFIIGSTNRWDLKLNKNGTTVAVGGSGGVTGDIITDLSFNVDMNGTTDYLEVFIYNYSAGSTTLIADDTVTYFQATRVSNVDNQLSNNLSVNMRATIASGTLAGTENPIIYTTVDYDTHNAYSTLTGEYTIPVAGKYTINAKYIAQGTYLSGQVLALRIRLNGTAITDEFFRSNTFTGSQMISSNTTLSLKAGDKILIGSYSEAGSPSLLADALYDIFEIRRVGN